MRDALVVVFAKAPVAGAVKTRLGASIGDVAARDVYRWLGERVFRDVTDPRDRGYDVCVRFAPREGEADMRRWLHGGDDYVPQGEGSLGERMERAARDGLAAGRRAVVLVGTDCLAVTRARVDEALAALDTHDAVMGPARDGGYYLLGMRGAWPLFEGIAWSTGAVAERTRELARGAGATLWELAVERDVDTLDDLIALAATRALPEWMRAAIRAK